MRPAIVCLLTILAAPVEAQMMRYLPPEGDTLRYETVSEIQATTQSPMGPVEVETRQNFLWGVTRSGEDRITLWYERAESSVTGPQGSLDVDLSGFIGAEFELRMTESGQLELLSAPDLPPELGDVSALFRQFEGIWSPFPEEKPEPGFTWNDTLDLDLAPAEGVQIENRGLQTYTVRGDTTLAGVTATSIEVRQELSVTSTTENGDLGMSVESAMSGSGTGLLVFDFERGLVLELETSGEMSGPTTMTGGPMPMELEQVARFSSRFSLVR